MTIDISIEFMAIIFAVIASRFLDVWGRLATYKNPHDSYLAPTIWSITLFLYLINLWFSIGIQVPESTTFTIWDMLIVLIQPCLVFFALIFLFPPAGKIDTAPDDKVDLFKNHFTRHRVTFFVICIFLILNAAARDYWEYSKASTDGMQRGFFEVVLGDELKSLFRGFSVGVLMIAAIFRNVYVQVALGSMSLCAMLGFLYLFGDS